MTSSLKPITLYAHASGPNPWKAAMVLEELGLPYDTKIMDFPDLKKEPYVSVNPNGRVPAIEDPNTGITLWESGSIIEYLIDEYDKEGKLSYTTSPEKYTTRNWAYFQVSGQGPYFGQKAWFTFFHAEKNIKSAIERYSNEIARVIGVIDAHLAKQGTQYLVGDKCTYADIMFITWAVLVPGIAPEVDLKPFEHYNAWLARLTERPAVKKVMEDQKKAKGE